MLQRKYKNLEDQMEKDKETWMIKEKDLKEKIRVIEQLKRDLEAEVSKLEKNLNEATKNNKGDNMQIEALRKELYVLSTARDQIAKELEAALAKAQAWPG